MSLCQISLLLSVCSGCVRRIQTCCAEKALPSEITDMPEYPHKYWAGSEEKEGYSGVAMLCKTEPLNVTYGIGKCLFFSFLYRFQYMAHVHCIISISAMAVSLFLLEFAF